MVNCALVMCGGRGKRFGADKSLIKYRGQKMIYYVLMVLKECGIKKLVLIANKDNWEEIDEEARKLFKDYILIKKSPKKFRMGISNVHNYLENDFLLIAGNQPLEISTIREIIEKNKLTNLWIASLYNPKLSNENNFVGISKEKITSGNEYILQHPLIVSKDIIYMQTKEKFINTIEKTIINQLNSRDVVGVMAKMPPDFDDKKMFENNKKFIDLHFGRELIILPGNDVSNKQWCLDAEMQLKEYFNESKILFYEHWKTGNKIINFELESNNLVKLCSMNKKFILFAKSVGCLIAIKCIADKKIFPEKCFFLGLPDSWAKRVGIEYQEALARIKTPIIFIQNDKDPVMSFSFLEETLKKLNVPNYKMYSLKNDSHNYCDFSRIKKIIAGNLT